MIFFYGTSGAKNTQIKPIEHSNCPKCQHENSLAIVSFTQYYHFWFIPFFPAKKKSVVECQVCENVFREKQLKGPLQEEIRREKDKLSIPIWYYSGAAVAGVLVTLLAIFITINGGRIEKERKEFAQNPKAGDRYDVITEEGNYTVLKIVEVTEDSLYYLINEYETDRRRDLDILDEERKYLPDVYVLSRKEMYQRFEDGDIDNIHRE